MKLFAVLFAAALLFGHRAAALPAGEQPAESVEEPFGTSGAEEKAPNSYIVVFKDDANQQELLKGIRESMERENEREGESGISSKISHEYEMDGFKGFAGTMTPGLLEEIKQNPAVALVEDDHIAHAVASQPNPPSWGLTRVGERNLDLAKPYTYPDSAGQGTTSYIIDTGIQIKHPDFGGRAVWGKTTCPGCKNEDDNGHGTHVAGTVGGTKFGVAKKTKLVAVKVLNGSGSGSYSGVIAGINWVAGEAKKAKKTVVANMSLGGPKNAAVNQAVASAFKAGVVMAVAAGNENQDACKVSPASTPEALTTAASDRTDRRASFSNWGKCVDLFAPGKDITSAWNNGGQRTISGTSMASPHVAGGAALVLGAHPKFSPKQVSDDIIKRSTPGKIADIKGSPNKLLFVN